METYFHASGQPNRETRKSSSVFFNQGLGENEYGYDIKLYYIIKMFIQVNIIFGKFRTLDWKTSPLDCTLGSSFGNSKHMDKVNKTHIQTWKVLNVNLINAQKYMK